MFRRKKPPPFDLTEHPQVLAALDAMWQQAYETGRRDAVAIARDFLAEEDAATGDRRAERTYLAAIEMVIDRLEL